MSTFSADELRAMLAAAEQKESDDRDAAIASGRVEIVVTELLTRAAALSAGAGLAGLSAPDLSTVLAAAVNRAAPVDPSDLSAVIDPAPAPVTRTADQTARRRRPDRDWTKVTSGSIWTARLAGHDGRVKITVDANGVPLFTATTGNRGTWKTATRAVQSACGDPTTDAPSVAGRGRVAATVNGVLALRDQDGARLIDLV